MNRQPMTPSQLDALRPKPVAVQPVDNSPQAIAYRCGVKDLAPVIQRLVTAEKNIAELTEKVGRLESELLAAKCEFR